MLMYVMYFGMFYFYANDIMDFPVYRLYRFEDNLCTDSLLQCIAIKTI